jgi:hypothetical protein
LYGWKEKLPISLDSKFHPILTYHDKDYDTFWCKNLKIEHEN